MTGVTTRGAKAKAAKGPTSDKEARAVLQRFVEASDAGGITFTEGAAQYLAGAAAERLMKNGGRSKLAPRVEAAKGEFHHVAERLAAEGGSKRLDQRTVTMLRKREAFCGIAPWC